MKNGTKMAIATSVLALGITANADTFNGAGNGTSWEDAANWAGGVVPLNNGSGNTLIDNDHDVNFNAATFTALLGASNTQNPTAQNPTEYRIARLLMGDTNNAGANGTHSLTLDPGADKYIRVTNGNSAVIGGRSGKFSTLNVLSGTTNLEAGRIRIGQSTGGSGTVNVSGGLLTLGRGGLELGATNGTGDGTLNITGGSFTTRNDAEIFAGGTFHVAGSSAATIGIGSNNSDSDGRWVQDGTLRTGIDAGGMTVILIDERDGNAGAGGNGNATFNAGSILDPYDLGGAATDVWTTVMTWEGALTDNGLALSASAISAGWEKQIAGSSLQVRLPSVPEPSTSLLAGLAIFAGLGMRRRK